MRLSLACVLASTAWLAIVGGCSTSSKSGSLSDGDSGEGGDAMGGARSEAQGGKAARGGAAGSGAGTGSSSGSSSVASGGATTGSGGSGGGQPTSGSSFGASEAGGAAGADDGLTGDAGEPGGPAPGGSECIVPCELELGPADNLPGDSAVVVYDFETGTATLTTNPAVNAAGEWVIGFNYETNPEYGYGSWSTGDWWFAYTDPVAYVEGTYGMKPGIEFTSELVNPNTNQILQVVYSFGAHSVSVQAIGVPRCDDTPSGACASEDDCASVDAGMLRSAAQTCSGGCGGENECAASCLAEGQDVTAGCASCYTDFVACVTAACPKECPGTGSDACMRCETDSACHLAFMACSGLGYMPRGTLTWPAAQTTL